MRKRFLKYCVAGIFLSTVVLSGTMVCYGQDDVEVEISEPEEAAIPETDSIVSEEMPELDIEEAEAFDDGDAAEVELSEDIDVSDAGTTTYAYSETETEGNVTLKVEWNDPILGQDMTFHVSAEGGSGAYKFRMDAPSYSNPNEYAYESVADPSRGEWLNYTDECSSHDYTFTMTASGTYNFRFYVMDKTSNVYYLRASIYIQVADADYPSVNSIIASAVSKCKNETDGSDYKKALWLHDWLIQQLDYDKSLKWSSAESALTRHLGTCQAYESAYSRLLTAVGIENAETRDTYDGHTWNAMKLDGEWYQVDCTWDDTEAHWYNFDQKRLYFGLTDELMALAHNGHTQIYTADGYATRSTSLTDNYFVRSGEAANWAETYADRIQQKLNAGETEFTISADNATYPPSISGIQNGIIAYAMSQMNWSVDGTKISLQAVGGATEFAFTATKGGSVTGEEFYGYTLNLDGTIAINMYMDLPENLATDANAYMEFVLPNGSTSRVMVKDALQKDGHYIFSGRVAAKEMSQDVKVRMYTANECGKEYSVSVQKYAEHIINHPANYDKYSIKLVKSLLNYGAAAQTLFDYHTDKLANENLLPEDKVISDVDFSQYEHSLNQNNNENGIKWYGSSLVLESDTCVRDYFSLDASSQINNYTFELGESNVTKLKPKQRVINGETYYYVEIPDIKAQNLDKSIEVNVRDQTGENIITLKYNAFSYAYSMSKKSTTDANTKQAMKALYQYWLDAKAYVDNKNKNV